MNDLSQSLNKEFLEKNEAQKKIIELKEMYNTNLEHIKQQDIEKKEILSEFDDKINKTNKEIFETFKNVAAEF